MLAACKETYLSLKHSVVSWNSRDGILSEIALPETLIEPNHGDEIPKISFMTVSAKGSYISAVDSLKQLVVYFNKEGRWLLVSQLKLRKQVSCLIFTPSEKALVIGDKSGDIFKLTLCLERPVYNTDLILLCGHLSLLSHMAISDDEMYLASCDRDEKIRISRFSEPNVIQSFCLGHKLFVSQLGFVPDTHNLISTGGDGYICVWDCVSGHCLSSYHISINELVPSSVSSDFEFDSRSEFVVSRLYFVKADIIVCSFLSLPVLLAFNISITKDTVFWGSKVFTSTPDKLLFIDIALCSNENRVIGLCSTPTSVCLYSWKLNIQYNTCQSLCTLQWDIPEVIHCVANDILAQVPVPSPRTELLKLFFKCTDNTAMIHAYKSNKQLHQQNVTQRHIRSQKTRKWNKSLRNSVGEK
ncbi:hypothetical protein MN116_007497 [Schistosoma mekongi]|uniref:tRNA (guanine-N(7)-)-methyltransferase non-catalytic subunit n=1 Tax=Schistosoma mekongi TaxID=38744 RepID=A0AAE2D2S1_SCHME|nr:hypothetical protein MN116_007497 [Schistosoma mekongi]